MKDIFLEVSYRRGEPFAAYLYVMRSAARAVARTEELRPGLLVDFDAKGMVMGLEIVHPGETPLKDIRAVLAKLRVRGVSLKDLAPLRAA